MIVELMAGFDEGVRELLGELAGGTLDDDQWEQVGLPVKLSGLGIPSGVAAADLHYLASRKNSFEVCEELFTDFRWEAGVAGCVETALGAAARLKARSRALRARWHSLLRAGWPASC